MQRIILFLCLIFSACAGANVHEYTLDNGMKVLVKPDHRAPVAVVMLWYNVGSADELPGKTGLAHALEHMMFKGTKTYPPGYFSKTIAGIGGQENAFTNTDYTAYFEKISAAQLPKALQMEAARMRDLIIDDAEFSQEIKVIQEERRMRTDDNPQGIMFERFMAAAHLGAPYQHPVIGWMSDLQQMKPEELRQWYQQYYAPNNASLVVVGDVEPERVLSLAQQYFSAFKPKKITERKRFPEPKALGQKSIAVQAEAKRPMVMLGYTVPSLPLDKSAWQPYALELLAGILSGGESARFAKHLVRAKESASSVEVYYNPFARYNTQFIIYGTPTQKSGLATMESDIFKEIQRLKTEPVSQKELARVKKQVIAQKVFSKDSVFGQAMEIGLLETVGLHWKIGETFADKLQAIDANQVQEVAKLYFTKDNLTRAELTPISKPRSAK